MAVVKARTGKVRLSYLFYGAAVSSRLESSEASLRLLPTSDGKYDGGLHSPCKFQGTGLSSKGAMAMPSSRAASTSPCSGQQIRQTTGSWPRSESRRYTVKSA